MNIKSIVGSLAAMALKKHLGRGGKVEIPSLGITILPDDVTASIQKKLTKTNAISPDDAVTPQRGIK